MSLLAAFVPTTAYSAYQMMMAHLEKGELVKTNKLQDGTELQQIHVKAMVELTRQQIGFQAPHYVNVGGTASYSIPIGGGTVQEEKPVLTIARTDDKTLLHYELIDLDDAEASEGASDTTFKTYYINEMEQFKRTMKTYDVDHNAVPANIPLKVYSIYPNKPMWVSNSWRILGADKMRVASKIASQRRLNSASFIISTSVAVFSGMLLAFERF
jgi:hypothetical protein